MKILITGGAGFQGSHLAEKLFELGHEVSVLNTMTPNAFENKKYLDGIQVIWGSITDMEVTEKAMRGKNIVYHLGGHINVDESIIYPRETVEANIFGTMNVLEAARRTNARIIQASTCEVYGRPEHTPITEITELRPMSPYAASKAAADRLCYAYAQTYKLNLIIPRFFNIFGERQKELNFGAVIPIFVGNAMRGEPIKVFGNGLQTRDYIYMSDVLNAYCLMLEHSELSGEVINFGSGVGICIRDIAEYIAKKFNTKVEYVTSRPGEATDMIADYSKAKRLLGWEPKVNFYEGLDNYIIWWQSQEKSK